MPDTEPTAAVPNRRAAAAAETRQRLIDAGFQLAERTGLNGLSVNLLVEQAGVSKGSFFHHFGDRTSYLLALHRALHEQLAGEMAAATAGLPPGAERMRVGATAYLDSCLRHRGVRALLLDARAEPAVRQEVARRNALNAALIAPDLVAVGRALPEETAALLVVTTAEVAISELSAGEPLPKLRQALFALLPEAAPGR